MSEKENRVQGFLAAGHVCAVVGYDEYFPLAEKYRVPIVVTVNTWVSPRVNNAEPWVRGNRPVRIVIGRTVRVSRPSMRGSPARVCQQSTTGRGPHACGNRS